MRFDVLVALSGGLDSCVATRLCQTAGMRCAALHVAFDGPAASSELRAARSFCEHWEVPLEVLTFRPSRSLPWEASPDDFFGPFTFLTLCCCLALSAECSSVALGLTQEQVRAFCRDPRWNPARELLRQSRSVEIRFPLRELSKPEISRLAPCVGVPLDTVWSVRTSEGAVHVEG